ncbi:DUF3168 domain-containing protein [Stakelama sp. CBK3Z-3]|uniref:DUF3168 domain-containing protein n=2 Tax=Stakelama flava TaxID=2860338 RepID=A0ABS6XK82_9SPHN|nr:DUF3168 domain-containing protein [Stakelama flava]
MSAGERAQAAVVAAVRAELDGDVSAVFDAPPVRSAMPYALVEEPVLADWSTKDAPGRAGRVSVLVHDSGERPARLRALAARIETAVAAMPSALGDGWRIAALTLTRSRIVKQRDGHWTALIEHRVAMLRSAD